MKMIRKLRNKIKKKDIVLDSSEKGKIKDEKKI